MQQLYSDLLDRLTTDVIQFDHFNDSTEITSENIKTCLKLNAELKQRFIQADHSKEEQIIFFKSIKPLFYSELLLQTKVHNFLADKPSKPVKMIKAHIEKYEKRSHAPFYEFPVFRNYMQLKSTRLDDYLFTLGIYDPDIMHLEIQAEPEFSSPADMTLATLLAAMRFQEYLERTSIALKRSKPTKKRDLPKPLKFNGSKVDLILTSYALSELSDADVKKHAEWLSLMYDEDLGDVYRGFHDIKKKKNPTAFLDKLKKAIFRRMDDDNDEE